MARARMIDKKISFSEKVAELEILGQLLYERMILHADDFGLLQISPRTIKAIVIPMIDTTAQDVKNQLIKMEEVGLLRRVKIEKREYYKIIDFGENQRFRRDINPQVIFPFEYGKKIAENWKTVKKIVSDAIKADTSRTQGVDVTLREVKLREDKIKEDNINTVRANGVLKKLPDITNDEEYISYIARMLAAELDDDHSEKFFRLVAAKVPEYIIRQALAEIKQDGAKNPAAVFTVRMQKFAIGGTI